MRTGEDIAVRADDDAAACAGLDLILAVPGPLRVDDLFGGDDHDAGADHLGDLRSGHAAGRDGGAGGRAAVGTLHLLDDDLVACIADPCAHEAACKAHGRGQHQRNGAAGDAAAAMLAALLRGLGGCGLRLRACRGRRSAAIAGGSFRRAGRGGVAVSARRVGGIHAGGADVGVSGIAGRTICRGIIVFPFVFIFHGTTSFLEGTGSGGALRPSLSGTGSIVTANCENESLSG